jgi:hypothetical protein
MAITSVKQIAVRGCVLDSSNNRSYTRNYLVITDDPLTTMVDVLVDSRVPQKGSFDLYDVQAECIRVSVQVPDADDPYLWHVEGEWATGGRNVEARDIDLALQASDPDQARADGNQHEESPTAQPIQVSWDFIPASSIFTHSFEINEPPLFVEAGAVTNSAHQLFDPPLEKDDGTLQLTIVQSVSNFDPEAAAEYYQTCNDDVWNGYPPGSVRLIEWSAKKAYERRTSYWSQTFRFVFAKVVEINGEEYQDWDLRPRDYGSQTRTVVAGAVKFRKIEDDAGNQISVNLDGSGQKLTADGPPVYLQYRPYERKDFDALGIPAF